MKYDHIIVGAGSMGSAAAYFLGKLGKKVLLVDAFTPPHTEGSHHGDTRLIRFAYGEGEKYVPFVLRAKELWDEIEQETGKEIFLQTGIINVGDKNDSFIQSVKQAANAYKLPLQTYTAKEAMGKWPNIKIPDNFIVLHETTSGVLCTKPAIEAYIEQAKTYDVNCLFNTKVAKIEAKDGKGSIETEDGHYFEAENVIVTAGAWAKQMMASSGLDIPVNPIRKTFAWFEVNEATFNEETFPGFTFQLGTESYYGFPNIKGAGLKVGRHDGGESIDPNEVRKPFGDVAGDLEDLQQFLHTYMPQAGALKEGKTCMYAMTPDEDFIIDRHPVHEEIIFAAGFSGHGFKFASAVGEILSEIAQGKETTIDIQPFSLKRFTK